MDDMLNMILSAIIYTAIIYCGYRLIEEALNKFIGK